MEKDHFQLLINQGACPGQKIMSRKKKEKKRNFDNEIYHLSKSLDNLRKGVLEQFEGRKNAANQTIALRCQDFNALLVPSKSQAYQHFFFFFLDGGCSGH